MTTVSLVCLVVGIVLFFIGRKLLTDPIDFKNITNGEFLVAGILALSVTALGVGIIFVSLIFLVTSFFI